MAVLNTTGLHGVKYESDGFLNFFQNFVENKSEKPNKAMIDCECLISGIWLIGTTINEPQK